MVERLGSLVHTYPHPGLLLGVTFLVSTSLTFVFYKAATTYSVLPKIRERDVHTKQKPRVGGVAMWLAVMASFVWLLLTGPSDILTFDRVAYLGIDRSLWGIMAGMAVLLLASLIDDVKGLHWSWQLFFQFLAALCLVAGATTISFIRLPLDYQIELNSFWSGSFTVAWVMLMMNVMNWFDGLDGLAGSIAVTAALALFFVSLQVGVIGTASLCLIVAAAAAGFLVWNWYPSKLFMGTVGSQLLGFLLGTIAIVSGGKLATAVLVLGIPVLDALLVIFRRLLAHKSPFQADQRHLHHRLLHLGLPVPWVVILINVVAITFGALAIYRPEPGTKGLLTLIEIMLMILFISITYLLELRVKKKVH